MISTERCRMEGSSGNINILTASVPHYAQIRWRLEVPLGSRTASKVPGMPYYTIALSTVNPISGTIETRWMFCTFENLLTVTQSVEEALAALDSSRYNSLRELIR
ncbi:uncharacterized protein TM35_000022200 [Trypanosoma theileri]|uniref:COMM domain-containing protein n=1 Tax=Trypanosoma theileri TaxID=67003 RepID=A0A1X0P7I8_9TRYP|nr:uncharacterized protein TM35_000022200 [Trypanosoma theileri]ORC92894.1 hypothetical protein TM35_000022200 [Trypanosoma theileri]